MKNTQFTARHSLRLRDYDYSQDGGYFITLCTHRRQVLFGAIVNGGMVLNNNGEIVREELLRTPQIRREIKLDEFVVMPNHVHAVILISRAGDRPVAPTNEGSIGALVAGFKSSVTRRINTVRQTPGVTLWQRNYYEHVIRDEVDLNQIRQYVLSNPVKWELDRENPDYQPTRRGDRRSPVR